MSKRGETNPIDWAWAILLFGIPIVIVEFIIGLAVIIGWVANSLFGRFISDSFR